MTNSQIKLRKSKDTPIMVSMMSDIKRNRSIYALLIPAFIFCIVFYYYPLFRGFIISVQDYALIGESSWAGFAHYKEILTDMDFWRALKNTLVIGGGNLFFGFIIQVLLALLLNEVMQNKLKRIVQTIIYTPNLFSWVAISGIFISILAPDIGMVNMALKQMGFDAINFMTSEKWIIAIFWFLNTWKTAGYGCIIYLAALTNIDPCLYEAARIDGAGRLKQVMHITIPGLFPTMKVVLMLNLIASLRMFSQSFILTNPSVIDKTEVVMTYTYKLGLQNFRMDYASAVAVVMLGIIGILTLFYQLVVKKTER